MSYQEEAMQQGGYGFYPAAMAAAEERRVFIKRTYLHVAGAVAVFAALLAGLVTMVPGAAMMSFFSTPLGWLAVLGGFMLASAVSNRLAMPDKPLSVQYMGLGIYIALQAFIFWPIIWFVGMKMGDFNLVYQAAILTLAIAGGLTVAAIFTGKDFSFLGPIISIGCWGALGLIVISLFFPITLGFWFAAAMVALMSGAILYGASNVMHHYPTNAYVAASLYIFAAIATMFWYVLQMLLASRR